MSVSGFNCLFMRIISAALLSKRRYHVEQENGELRVPAADAIRKVVADVILTARLR